MKVLLIRLKSTTFSVPPPDMPLGLLYLASSIEAAGHEIVVRDLNWQEIDSEIAHEIKSGRIGVVGISMMSFVRSQGYELVTWAKNINRNVRVVIGGLHASAMGAEILRSHDVDAVVVGEGEASFVELIDAWECGADVGGIAGVLTKEYGRHEARRLIVNLDTIPFPAWHHTDIERFTMTCTTIIPDRIINEVKLGGARWVPVIASRGCVGRCIFCNAFKHWGNKVRFRSPANLLDEIEVLYNNHGVRLLAFNDDAFPVNKKQCLDFCDGLRMRGIRIAWQTTTRADALDDEVCEAMADAGCFMVAVGIESGSPKIHSILKKYLDLDKAAGGIDSINKTDMISYALLMIGNPGETSETIDETIAYLKKVKPRYYSFVEGVMIVPDTDLCAMAGIDNAFWTDNGIDGLPLYLKENPQATLHSYGQRIAAEVPRCL